MVCGRAVRGPRFEGRQAVCVYHRRIGKSQAHSQQSPRERRALRHARPNQRRVGSRPSGNSRRRRSATWNAVAEQKVCSLETTLGFLRHVPQTRAHRFRDSPHLIPVSRLEEEARPTWRLFVYRPRIMAIPECTSCSWVRDSFPTRVESRFLPRVMICDTFTTESLGSAVCRAERDTFPTPP